MRKLLFVLAIMMLLLMIVGCMPTNKFIIELESDASTGYDWEYVMSAPDIVEQISYEYVLSGVPLTGTGGKTVFTFESVRPGDVELTFCYRQPWDTDSVPEMTVQVLLSVNEDGTIIER